MSIELSLANVEHIVKETGFSMLQRSMLPTAFNTNIR